MKIGREHLKLVADTRFVNGWRYVADLHQGTVGNHQELPRFLVDRFAAAAPTAWARGVERVSPPALRQRFSYNAFIQADDPEALGRELEGELTARLRAHPSPEAAFEASMEELKAAGHDIWSDIPGEVWGPDYTKERQSGLYVTRFEAGDEESIEDDRVEVQFRHPREAGQ